MNGIVDTERGGRALILRLRRLPPWAWAAVAAALVFLNTLPNQFVMDDFHLILNNNDLHSLAKVPGYFLGGHTTTAGVFFRPFGIAWLAFDWALFGRNPMGYHLLSLALHALASLLVALIGTRLASRSVGLAAGLLFALHPIHTEAVSGAANCTEVLATIFFLLVFFVHSAERSLTVGRAVLCNVLCLLGLLSKENVLTLPVVLMVYDWLLRKDRRSWVIFCVLLPSVFLYLLMRNHAMGFVSMDPTLSYFYDKPTSVRILTMVGVAARYATLLVCPVWLSVDYYPYAIPDIHGFSPWLLAGALVLAGCSCLIVLGRRRAPLAAFGTAWLLIGMAPYSHFTPLGNVIAERFLYLPSVGFCLAVALGFSWLAQRISRPPLIWGLGAVLLAWFAVRTLDRNLDWQDQMTIGRSAVEVYPESSTAHLLLAMGCSQKMQVDCVRQELFEMRRIGLYSERLQKSAGSLLMWLVQVSQARGTGNADRAP
jgi:hypothetical protein